MVMAPSASDLPRLYFNDHVHEKLKHVECPDDETRGISHLAEARAASRQLVFEILKQKAAAVDVKTCYPGEEDPFYVADLGEVYRQHIRWKTNLPRVKPFYGMFSFLLFSFLFLFSFLRR